MSLKAFHIVFVTASILLAIALGSWCINNFMSPEGTRRDLMGAVAAVIGVIVLLVYGRYFLKKLKNISYL